MPRCLYRRGHLATAISIYTVFPPRSLFIRLDFHRPTIPHFAGRYLFPTLSLKDRPEGKISCPFFSRRYVGTIAPQKDRDSWCEKRGHMAAVCRDSLPLGSTGVLASENPSTRLPRSRGASHGCSDNYRRTFVKTHGKRAEPKAARTFPLVCDASFSGGILSRIEIQLHRVHSADWKRCRPRFLGRDGDRAFSEWNTGTGTTGNFMEWREPRTLLGDRLLLTI